MEIIRPIVRIGNSSGVILPKEWLNGKARVELLKRPLDIKKDIIDILDSYLDDIIGVYLVGSYARGEQTPESDVDILVVSNKIDKNIKSGKYNIEVIPLGKLVNILKTNPIMVYPRFIEAIVILNQAFLDEVRRIKLNLDSFKSYLKNCKEIIEKNQELIELDKLEGNILSSLGVIYSLLLRLRAVYMLRCILTKKIYSNKDFRNWVIYHANIGARDFAKLYGVYRSIRDDKKIKSTIELSLVEKLIDLLEKKVKKYSEKKKKT